MAHYYFSPDDLEAFLFNLILKLLLARFVRLSRGRIFDEVTI